MQARKLLRLLTEMIEEKPHLAYAQVCVDKRYTEKSGYTYKAIEDCETRVCDRWNDVDTCREIVVLGNY